MAKEKFQVNMVGSEDTPIEQEREMLSRVLDIFLKKQLPEVTISSELTNNKDTYD